MSWSTEFEDPIPGMITLSDAADHIKKLPKATQQLPHWQAAVEALTWLRKVVVHCFMLASEC